MPFVFQAILLMGITSYMLAALLFTLTRNMPRINPGTAWWAISSIAGGIGYFSLLVYVKIGDPSVGESLYNIGLLSWSTFLYIGTQKWLGRDINVLKILVLLCLVTGLVIYYSLVEPVFLPAAIATSLCCGVLNLHLCWCYYWDKRKKDYREYVLIVLLFISGFHWLDYPFLRHNETIGHLGFFLCTIISVFINICMASIIITVFKQRMLIAEKEAIDKAMHDPLTGLKNRLALDKAFVTSLAAAQNKDTQIAIVFGDLDRFKMINDTYGHDVGDRVLIAISARIKAFLKPEDVATRIGGDEFVIMLNHFEQNNSNTYFRGVIDALVEDLKQPIEVNGIVHKIGISIGVACYPDNGTNLTDLLNHSDKSMYLDKMVNKNS